MSRRIAATYDYVDEHGELLFEVVRYDPKDFRQRRPDGRRGWVWSLDGCRRVLYRLPRVLEAVARGEPVYVAEGEKDVEALEQAGVVATTNPGGAGKWRDEYSETLRGAKVVIVAHRDEAGAKHVTQVAWSLAEAGAKTADVSIVKPAVGKDASDHLAAGKTVEEFVLVELPASDGKPCISEPVDGAELLEELRAFIERFVVLPSAEVADLTVLWTLHTHALDAAYATPYLRVTSATAECGKSLLLELLEALCARGWYVVRPSTATLYRKVEADQSTLLLDEMDRYSLDDQGSVLDILNAGYKRGARVPRCDERGQLREFECFSAKAYAGIDKRQLPDTLLSRSVTIRLERKLPSDNVEMWLGAITAPQAVPLHDRAAAWAEQNVEQLRHHRPELPAELQNRAAEVWWALLAIAELVGGDWPKRARRAARVLSAGADATDEADRLVQLLADIRAAFGDRESIFTKLLLAELNALDESPWGAYRQNAPEPGLDARGLSKLLRPLGIKPRSVRMPGVEGTSKGYHFDQFADAFSRYLPEAAQAAQPNADAERDVPGVPDVPDTADRRLSFEEAFGDAEYERLRGERAKREEAE